MSDTQVVTTTSNPFAILPAKVRVTIYAATGLLVLLANAVLAFYGAVPDIAMPNWLPGVVAAISVIAVPALGLATGNVMSDAKALKAAQSVVMAPAPAVIQPIETAKIETIPAAAAVPDEDDDPDDGEIGPDDSPELELPPYEDKPA